MAVGVQLVLSGTSDGPDSCNTNAKEWSALGISSFLPWLFFSGGFVFVFFSVGEE